MKTRFMYVGLILGIGALLLLLSRKTPGTTLVTIGAHTFTVEVAATPQQISQGLSGREQVGADGMLFMMPRREVPLFWMKDMHFPLDFIWIDGNTVVDLTEHVPAPDPQTPLEELPRYSPAVPATHVLEVPVGIVSKLGIQKGDAVRW